MVKPYILANLPVLRQLAAGDTDIVRGIDASAIKAITECLYNLAFNKTFALTDQERETLKPLRNLIIRGGVPGDPVANKRKFLTLNGEKFLQEAFEVIVPKLESNVHGPEDGFGSPGNARSSAS